MTRLAAICLAILPLTAHAQDAPQRGPHDEWTLDRITDDRAVVEFWNASPPNSGHIPDELVTDGLTVGLHVQITSGPETMTVLPPAGWVAIPPEVVVEDGALGRVVLYRGGVGM